MGQRLLITGGAGYLGGRLVEHFRGSGVYAVRCASRKSGFDLFSAESLQRHCESINAIVHLASPNEIESAERPDEALRVTALGTLHLLDAARRAGVQRVIFLSTAHVYGSPLAGTITEQVVPRPAHPYAIAHRCAEDYVLSYNDERKIQGIVVRLSNVLGAPSSPDVNRWSLVTNDLCRQAVTQNRLVLKSAGLQWRDFISMFDFCRAIEHLLALPSFGDGLYNLGAGECHQIREIAERIANRFGKIYGVRPEVVRPSGGQSICIPPLAFNSSKLQATGFQLLGKIDDEIDATLHFCQVHFR